MTKKEKVNDVNKKITRFGYIINKKSLNEEKVDEIKKELTAKPFKAGNFGKFAKDNKFPLYVENGDFIGIPKYYGLEKFGEPDINRLESYKFPEFNMKYTGKLRPNQEVIVNKIFDGFEKHRGGLLIAGCGSGKTNMAIYIACKYKLKTLFIVHKTFLKNQVINRIKSTTNIKKIGIIQQKKVETEYPFVVGMVQSLAKIDYDDIIFRDFGMIIIDEVHHMGARNFSRVYQKMSAKYMLGISAERRRNDGMYKIINWYMGPILHAEEQKPNDMVVVKKFHYKTSNKERSKVIINKYTGEPDRSTMVTNIVHIKRRNRFILKMIEELFDQGKNVLFLSGRLKQVNLFYRMLNKNEYIKGNVGEYIGGMSEEDLSESATKQIILGTYSMAEEGLDIENLNVVILSTPKSAIKQSVGRILRKEIYEEHPIVIDIIDDDNAVLKKQSNARDAYYKKQHYNIQEFRISDYKLKGYNDWDNLEAIKEALTKVPEKRPRTKQIKDVTKFFGKVDCSQIEFLDD
ncbi:putative ATP-dependent RNA helicase [Tupanvirus soda lake]|uniref:ATP-dependent RNA helicase n=2 Tax=Tupanvirus TaxID=2094720 RepID=A0AC62ABT0_9VIRU|nr:putative ATP-dependent RNA helicase [Tupanvirus soda lake]QKU35245.1 putative ATP-dependent RNA helicase [Tupanvirus soda lake]